MRAVEKVKEEELFKVESEYTSAAVKTAQALEDWWKKSPSNLEVLKEFSHILYVRLDACFACNRSTLQLRKERMWGSYHRLRSAETFVRDWQKFLSFSVKMKAFPSFISLWCTVFKELIKMHYPVSCGEGNESELPSRPLTCEEQNALRYVAGYVIRKLRERIDSSSNPRMDEMVLLLMECAGDEMESDGGTEMWLNMIDRGGLGHVKDQTYSLFVIMEEEIRRYFSRNKDGHHKQVKVDITKSVLQNEDLLFEWCLISFEADNDIATDVLRHIVELYTTIRGFAFVKSCIEMYKQAHQKTLQKKRALHSTLS